MRTTETDLRSFCIAVVVVASLVGGTGCQQAGPEPGGPPWVDLVLEAGPEVVQTVHHDDQTFLGIPLTHGAPSIVVTTPVDHPESLLLSGGYSRQGEEVPDAGRLFYSVREGDETVVDGVIELSSGQLWWDRVVQLPTSLHGPVSIRIEAGLPPGHLVFMRNIRVRQQISKARNSPRPPQMILISIDTLREDALGVYGGRWRTPNLDALAAEGQRWSRSYSGAGWTKPSHATMLTGYRGDTHEMSQKGRVLNSGLPTLAQRLRAAGIATGGFVHDCKWLDPKWGFDRGFDTYEVMEGRAERSVYPVVNWLSDHRGGPFFLFFHTFEVHSDWYHLPYESPGTTVEGVDKQYGVTDYGCVGERCASQHLNDMNNGVVEPLPNEAEILRELYGRGVEETDRALGVLFTELKRIGLWDKSLIIVTSDHGEAFLEHGRFLHGSVWNEIVRVPLIIKWPDGRAAGSVGRFATNSIDIAPTFLEFAGLALGDLPGTPLQRLDEERPIMIGGPNRMLVSDGWKINVSGNARDVHFLSKIAADPGETRNLADARKGRARRMLRTLRELVREDFDLRTVHRNTEEDNVTTLTDEEQQKLKALGYLEE